MARDFPTISTNGINTTFCTLSIGSTRSSTLILKLLLGAFFGFAFFIINQIFGPIALILHLPTILGAAGPTVIALILLIYLFIKSKET